MNRQQRRAMKSKKKQGVRVSNGGNFASWQALENRTAIFNNKKLEEE